MKTTNKLTHASRFLSLFLGVMTFSTVLGLTGFSSSAEAAGWRKINRYWYGYFFDNGDWQFYYNDGRVKGAGNYRRNGGGWSHFYGYSSTKSYVRQPGQWHPSRTIYGTPGPLIK